LELTGEAKPSITHGLTDTGTGSAHQQAAGQVFGQAMYRTELFLQSKPRLLAGCLDLLLTLAAIQVEFIKST